MRKFFREFRLSIVACYVIIFVWVYFDSKGKLPVFQMFLISVTGATLGIVLLMYPFYLFEKWYISWIKKTSFYKWLYTNHN